MGFKSVKIESLPSSGAHYTSGDMGLTIGNGDHNERQALRKRFGHCSMATMTYNSIQMWQQLQLRNLLTDHKVLRPGVEKLRIRDNDDGEILVSEGFDHLLKKCPLMIVVKGGSYADENFLRPASMEGIPIKGMSRVALAEHRTRKVVVSRQVHFPEEVTGGEDK